MRIPEWIKSEIIRKGGIKGLKKKLPKNQQIQKLCAMLCGLSAPIRVKILNAINIQPLCVCVLKEILNIPDSKLSYHLSSLANSGLVYRKREGKWIIYYPTKLGKTFASLFTRKKMLLSKGSNPKKV